MYKGPVMLLSFTLVGVVLGLTLIPSLLGFGNVAETACEICDHRSAAFDSTGILLPVAASSIAGVLLGSLLFWRPERQIEDVEVELSERVCASCGRGIEMDWSLCPFCGQSVAPAEEPTTGVDGG